MKFHSESQEPISPVDVEQLLPVETWRDRKHTAAPTFAGARVLNRWPIGREITEADYDAAISKFQSITIGG